MFTRMVISERLVTSFFNVPFEHACCVFMKNYADINYYMCFLNEKSMQIFTDYSVYLSSDSIVLEIYKKLFGANIKFAYLSLYLNEPVFIYKFVSECIILNTHYNSL